MPRYQAIGFDLLTALLHTWTLWEKVAGSVELGHAWHASSQALLRGQPYFPFEDNVRRAAAQVGIDAAKADELLARWGEFDPWPDTPIALAQLPPLPRFIVTNCSMRLGRVAALRAGGFDLVVTAEEAGAYKPDPRPYRTALGALGLDARRVLFVAGSSHDVGGAARLGMDVYWANRGGVPAPADATALREEPDLRALPEVVG